jgi:hypothetical protein
MRATAIWIDGVGPISLVVGSVALALPSQFPVTALAAIVGTASVATVGTVLIAVAMVLAAEQPRSRATFVTGMQAFRAGALVTGWPSTLSRMKLKATFDRGRLLIPGCTSASASTAVTGTRGRW